jgi:D-alanyl-D-alanine carboxypeptidase/D-alanyl-D-alanine-endopeptidase (penicillin-binding protein 4)
MNPRAGVVLACCLVLALAAGVLPASAQSDGAAPLPPKPPVKPDSVPLAGWTPDPLPADDPAGLIRRRGFQPDDVGYRLTAADGTVLASANADSGFIPASVAKLPTAVAALEILGGDHRFRTRLVGTAAVTDGRLQGDLYLVGGGDPLLGPDDLLALCQDLRRAGVREVAGAFRYDASRYATREMIRRDQPEDKRYNPPVSALSLDFNRMQVHWRRRGGRTQAWSLPELPGIRLGAARPGEVPLGQTWTRGPDGWELDPQARQVGRTTLPQHRPARVTAQLARRLCDRAGVDLPAPEPGVAPAGARALADHASPPLTDVVQRMLLYSNNLVAELVGLAAARRLTGQALDLPEAARLLGDWLASTVPGADWSAYAPDNSSGLASSARATPAQLTALLRYALDKRYGSGERSLMSLLPAAGGAGTLSERMTRPDTAFDVWAKTGSMHFASGLAGYILAPDGATRTFAVFVNDQALRQSYDADPRRRDGSWNAEIYPWRSRAKALEADLVRLWARQD